jgi:hypothetical protein
MLSYLALLRWKPVVALMSLEMQHLMSSEVEAKLVMIVMFVPSRFVSSKFVTSSQGEELASKLVCLSCR